MTATLTVLNVTLPVFFLATIGFVWVRAGFDYPVTFITRFSMSLAVPALIFVALMTSSVSTAALAQLSLATIATYAGVSVLSIAVVWLMGLDSRTYLAPLIMGNTGNLGLPLALFAFGDAGLGLAVVVFAIMAIYSFTIGIWMVTRSTNPATVVKEPIVGATLLGALFLIAGWETPQVVTRTLSLLGDTAIPLMLITLGVAIARLKPSAFGRAAWLSLLKALMCSITAFVIGSLFSLPPIALAVLVIQVSTPVAVTSYLLAEKYGADADAVAGLVVVSTLMSVAVLPVLLGLFL